MEGRWRFWSREFSITYFFKRTFPELYDSDKNNDGF